VSKGQATWLAAKEGCHSASMKMAQLETDEEFQFVSNLYEKNFNQLMVIFVGLEKRGTGENEDWFWCDKTTPIESAIPWGPDEPNNANNNEDCGALGNNYKYKLIDLPRTGMTFAYLCETVVSGH
jgi:hypothetical protein